jgi:energy-coupling factor transporter ATP-binding protein EcfA2
MDSTPTAPTFKSDINIENESSESSTLEDIAGKFSMAADKVARERNLSRSIVMERMPPIDICVFGRSGIGKSELIKAITHLDIPSSAQIDHVTQMLTEASTTIGTIKFRFWDTKGIDNWLDIDAIDNLFNEMMEQKIRPIFIFYCAAAGGRVDTDIVAAILKRFQSTNMLICYVVTNIYAASFEQLGKQIEGGRVIMDHVFGQVPNETGKFSFEYRSSFDNPDGSTQKQQGILIGVNSYPFNNIMGTMPIYNIHELMNFLAGNLNDEDFSKFVALTMTNRDFWDRVSDGLRTRLQRASETLPMWKIQTVSFFKRLLRLE